MGALLEFDPVRYKILPGLAKHWEISANNKTYTFSLRRRIKWSDSKAFSTDNVIFAFEVMI